VIRNFLKGAIPPGQVKHAYIPDLYGKEKRKAHPGKEGKLGVEGMRPEVLETALRRAGATILGEDPPDAPPARPITKADLFRDGLVGGYGSAEKRKKLEAHLGLPQHLSSNSFLQVLNSLMCYEEYVKLVGSSAEDP
jgi:ribonuclease M5